MFAWLSRRREPAGENEILNAGLELALEWGKNWLKPIQERLSRKYPQLTREQLDAYEAVCRAARKYGEDEIFKLAEVKGKESVVPEEFKRIVLARYPWVSPANLSRLLSQGMYYAAKDGL